MVLLNHTTPGNWDHCQLMSRIHGYLVPQCWSAPSVPKQLLHVMHADLSSICLNRQQILTR